ncbi:MAG: sulfite exporter TauE/SafE family protein [Chloroflexi bacterium]|nr:MAG: sulfite exporter TauE/SafE family protein [Chloroflexota bacterium]
MIPLELALGFGIGLALGLLGGGGSILTVPALVYLVGQTPQAAVTTSLAIVGANSLMGALFHRSQGTLDWKVAFTFGGAGILISYLSAKIASHLPAAVLLVAFALLMLAIGIMLFFRRANESEASYSARPLMLVLASGAGVGLLTGVLGVGGGFLVVPALVMLVGLPVQMAVGTSLVVIAMNSAAGFLGHAGNGSFDLILTLIFASAGLAGTFAGAKLSNRISASKLQRAFAGFVIALALFLLFDNLPKIF